MAEPRSKSRLSGLNGAYSVILPLLAVAAALPVGSNRPAWWLLWTMAIAGLFTLYCLLRLLLAPQRPWTLAGLGWILAVACLVPAFGLLQSLSVAQFLPISWLGLVDGLAPQMIATPSLAPDASFIGALRLCGYLMFLVLVIEIAAKPARARRMAVLLFIGITAQGLWALVALRLLGDFSIWGEKAQYQGFATGTFINRNSLATYLGFGLVLGIGLVMLLGEGPKMRVSRPRSALEKLGFGPALVLIGQGVILIALLATGSRLGVMASVLGAALTLGIVLRRSGVAWSRIGLATFLLILFGLVPAVLGSGEGLMNRAIFLGVDGEDRLEIYRQVLNMIWVRPLVGFGLDAFAPAFESFRAPPLNNPVFYDLAHNSYLALWAELGVIVGSIFPLMLALVGIKLIRRLDDSAANPNLLAVGLGVLLLAAVHSLGDFSLEIPADVLLFLAIIGISLGYRQSERPKAVTAAGFATAESAEEILIATRRNPE